MHTGMSMKTIIVLTATLLLFCTIDADAMTHIEANKLIKEAIQGNTASLQQLKQAASHGSLPAQNGLGNYYYSLKQYDISIHWFRKAAGQGYARSENMLGFIYAQGQGVSQNYVSSIFWFRKAAEQGYAKAEIALGVAYYFGQSVEQNYVTSDYWFRKAAVQGNASAETMLGNAYYHGYGIAQNRKEAIYWWTKATAQGNAEANQNILNIEPGK